MDKKKCECGMPIDEKVCCQCNGSVCKHCCNCDDNCDKCDCKKEE